MHHLLNNIARIASTPGIVGIVVCDANEAHPREYRGETSWKPVLDATVSTLLVAQALIIRVSLEAYTVHVQREGDQIVAVAFPSGHALVKSLNRLLYRAAHRTRSEVVC